jgi:5-oxopent-3-ene-1,2,5-tricarboxylate decarboxylase/2-hydroxyhepta-2,4-diene-1,7-dioate isomerase
MHYECELAVVIGRRRGGCRRADALRHVAGYTVANDYADPRLPGELVPPQPARQEPRRRTVLGPLARRRRRRARPACLALRTLVNGRVVQQGNTRDMIHDIPALIEYLSSFMTLQRGDVILTGTPEGVVNVERRRRGRHRDRRHRPPGQHAGRRRLSSAAAATKPRSTP